MSALRVSEALRPVTQGCAYCAIVVAEADADPKPILTDEALRAFDLLGKQAEAGADTTWAAVGILQQHNARPDVVAWQERDADRRRRAQAIKTEAGHDSVHERHCLECHQWFWRAWFGPKPTYCSNACKQRAYRKRKATP